MISRRVLKANDIKMFVLDEADEMLSRGFKDQIYDVFKNLPSSVQVVLLSATMPAEVLEVSPLRRFFLFIRESITVSPSHTNSSLGRSLSFARSNSA